MSSCPPDLKYSWSKSSSRRYMSVVSPKAIPVTIYSWLTRKERCAQLGVIRYCCRRILLSSLDVSEHLNAFDTADVNMDQGTVLQVVHTGTTRLPTL